MATFESVAVQTVATQQNVLFTTPTCYSKNCQGSILYTNGSGLVSLRGSNCPCNPAKYRVTYGANIAVPTGGTVGPIALALSLNGEALLGTQRTVAPTVVDAFFAVSGTTEIEIPCGGIYQIAVKNVVPTGGTAQDINVSNASLTITRVA